jgi:hypothetical protein
VQMSKIVAKVTKQKSAQSDRFQCSQKYEFVCLPFFHCAQMGTAVIISYRGSVANR